MTELERGPKADASRFAHLLRPTRTVADAEVARMLRQAADTVFARDPEHADRLRRRADQLDPQPSEGTT